nr:MULTISPECIES: hypothetical protein [unclassified Rathayibacter]
MTVVVLRPDGDQPDARAERVVEGGRLVGGAVVRDLDDVDPADRQPGDAPLLLLAEVAQECDGERAAAGVRADVDPEGHARLVAPQRAPPLRPLDPPAQRAERAAVAADRLLHGDPGAGERRPVALVVAARGGPDERGIGPSEDGVEPADVVEVVVSEHQQRDPVHSHQAEAGLEWCGLGPRVDEQHARVSAEEDRVALPDVAHRDTPVLGNRGGAEERRGDGGAAGGRDRARQPDGGDPAHPREPRRLRDEHEGEQGQHGERERSSHAGPPGDPRSGPRVDGAGDRGDPPGGNGGETDRRVGGSGPPGSEQAADEPEPGRGGCRGLGEQVGEHSVHRHRRVHEQQHGLAGELRRGRHREQQGERPGQHPTESARDRLGEQQESGGGEDGQHEAEPPRDRGVGGHEEDDGREQSGHGRSGATPEPREEDHRRHHGGPHHARLGGHQHHEAGEQGEGGDGPEAAPGAEERRDRPAGDHHHGAVGARDGGQVGERRGAHRLLEPRVERGRVAGREARQQPRHIAADQRRAFEEARAQHLRDGRRSPGTAPVLDGRRSQHRRLADGPLLRRSTRLQVELGAHGQTTAGIGEQHADGGRGRRVSYPQRRRVEPHSPGRERSGTRVDAHGDRSEGAILLGLPQRRRVATGRRSDDGGEGQGGTRARDEHRSDQPPAETAPEQDARRPEEHPARGAPREAPVEHCRDRQHPGRPRGGPRGHRCRQEPQVRRPHAPHGATWSRNAASVFSPIPGTSSS